MAAWVAEGDFVHAYAEPDAQGNVEIFEALGDGCRRETVNVKHLLWVRNIDP